ncbi:glyoxylase-like metal-dependent hydrolase (beta-lactamase superfamily II) [Lacrimispora xylanisolvens]|uniref:Glyoxylase-like metal-dependent hydrolase (Beta-lactamase superfamily II) n=1 Tax=Lacrimispora xylanisolvens TaxID=384636 RepID=A0A2S6HTB0_9FIRM|nr:MBL fold metallo-hydrolase [Hungatella xylanolytica]PPK80995.1 glyoxylase-like metal-dependent hydrolase (beta-lactamase superfamily II) [Hungatella xylanolytica]
MRLNRLTENIYYTECDSNSDRPVLGYINGDRCSVMVDAGNSGNHVKDYNFFLTQQGLKKPKYCIITHWHWDHTYGLHAVDAETIAHTKTNQELVRMSSWEFTDSRMKERLISGEEIAFADEHIRAEYPKLKEIKVVPALITFEQKIVLDCGSITCECMHLPSAHSDDSVAVFVPEERVIFLGDIYNDGFYQNHYRDLEKTKQLYQELSMIDFELAVVGHSEPVRKDNILNFLHRFF